jgi:hypothetical protein
MEQIGKARHDVAAEMQGRLMRGVTSHHLGEFAAARDLLEQCQELDTPRHRAVYWVVPDEP